MKGVSPIRIVPLYGAVAVIRGFRCIFPVNLEIIP